jgi:hypothetical protein
MALSALGVIPGVGGLVKGGRKIFGGVRGAANDAERLAAMRKAAELRAAGVDKRDIWYRTGWTSTPDESNMFEISDQAAKLNKGKLDHPELFRRYPETAKTKVEYKDLGPNSRGEFDPAADIITLNKADAPEDQLNTALHEYQHKVDMIEGRMGGSTPERGKKLADQLNTSVKAASTLEAVQAAKHLMRRGTPQKAALDFVSENADTQLDNRMLEKFSMAPDDAVADELMLARSQIRDLRSVNVTPKGFENYTANVSEARARATEARRQMNQYQRSARHPEDTMEFNMQYPVETAKQLRR